MLAARSEEATSDSAPTVPGGRWPARLELWFEPGSERTRLARRLHSGPLVVQRPFYPERDGTAHVYLLHPPGGVAGGDSLEIACHLGPGARVLLTMPGATKFYRSVSNPARMRTMIEVGAGAVCEYLPQETILFDGADAAMETRIALADDATYTGWEFVSLGRPAAGEGFAGGTLRQRVEVIRAGRPIWFERLALGAGPALLEAPFAFGGKPIVGTMVHAGPAFENTVERIREAVAQERASDVFSASQLKDILVCRYLGESMSQGKALFRRAWEVLRRGPLGKPAIAPRVWST